MKRELTLLAGTRNDALASGELPTRLKILNWGESQSSKGPIRVGPLTLSSIREQIAEGALARIVVDFEHNSEPGSPRFQPPPRRHAGYGSPMVVENDGIYLCDITWTPSGKEFAREYCDLSPTVAFDNDVDREVTLFKSLALTPNGAVKDLTFFEHEVNQQETKMDYKANLIALLKLSADCTDQDIADAMAKATTGTPAAAADSNDFAANLEAMGKTIVTLNADLGVLRQTVADQEKKIVLFADVETRLAAQGKTMETFSAELTKRDKNAVLDRAAAQGKIVMLDAGAVSKLSVADLEDHVAKITATVPLSARTPKTLAPEKTTLSAIEQYNAISDPGKRAEFFEANRKAISGS